MIAWTVVFVFCCVIFAVWQLWWTRQHARNLDRHEEEMKRIYDRYR